MKRVLPLDTCLIKVQGAAKKQGRRITDTLSEFGRQKQHRNLPRAVAVPLVPPVGRLLRHVFSEGV